MRACQVLSDHSDSSLLHCHNPGLNSSPGWNSCTLLWTKWKGRAQNGNRCQQGSGRQADLLSDTICCCMGEVCRILTVVFHIMLKSGHFQSSLETPREPYSVLNALVTDILEWTESTLESFFRGLSLKLNSSGRNENSLIFFNSPLFM